MNELTPDEHNIIVDAIHDSAIVIHKGQRMNKRLLLALYDRSGLGAYMPVDYKGHELAVEEHMEKFAELIVRECAGVSENHKGMNDKYFIADAIKKHFGVEE